MVVDAKLYTAQDLYQRYIFCTHTQVVLQEVGIHNRAGDTHTGVTHREITLTTHRSYCLGRTGEAQDFLCHVSRDCVIIEILHVMSIDTEGWQTLLCMCGKNGSQVYCTRTLCAIESPHSLRIMRIHIHGLRTIAPTRSYRDGSSYSLTLEFLGTGSTLCHSTNSGVTDNTLNG